MKKFLESTFNVLEKAIVYIDVTGLAIMLTIIFYQVVARYVFNKPPTWSEEIALLLMIWVTLLGAGIGVRRNLHMRVEIFLNLFPKWLQKLLEVIVLSLLAYFGYMMIKYSYILSVRLPNKMPATGIPVWWMYLPAVVCGVLILFSIFVKITVDLLGGDKK